MGQQTLEQTSEMSALLPKADIRRSGWDLRKVPEADALWAWGQIV